MCSCAPQRLCLNGSTGQEVVVRTDLQNVEALSFDPISRLLYWVDAGARRIEVTPAEELVLLWQQRSFADGTVVLFKGVQLRRRHASHSAQLLHPGTSQSSGADSWREVSHTHTHTRGLWWLTPPLVSPSLMFWTDWGDRVAGVYRGYMDGSNVSCIVSEGVRWPNGITADDRWLYWTEAFSDRIERADFTGGQRSVLVEGLPHPYAIAVFKVSATPTEARQDPS